MTSTLSSLVSATLQSAGPLLFVPEVSPGGGAVLFAGDVSAGAVRAFELAPEGGSAGPVPAVEVEQLGAKVASLLGVERDDVVIRGMAVHPASGAVYLSVARGRGAGAGPAVVRVGQGDGVDGVDGVELSVVELDDLPVTSFELDDAPEADDGRLDIWVDGTDEGSAPREFNGVTLQIAQVPIRRSTITDLAWIDGALYVAGLSNEEFSSRLRRIDYPFVGSAEAASVEIFHVDHGKYETESPIRALTSFDGGAGVLATYTCTPVVHFTVDELRGGGGGAGGADGAGGAGDSRGVVRGRTVAELGPMNQPFSIVSYDRDGEEFVLVSNTRHPLLKIPASSIADQSHLDVPISEEGASRGVPREELDLPGVTWMANLDRTRIVVLQSADGDLHLRTLEAAQL